MVSRKNQVRSDSHVVIMAGGTGTRLWPVSRRNAPKQGQSLMGDSSMAQKTFARLRRGWPSSRMFVSTNDEQVAILRKQLPQIPRSHFFLEPVRRDTAAAIGLAATYLWKKNPRAAMFTASSDHHFKQVDEYIRTLKAAEQVLAQYPERTVLVGVKPTFPHTGLGYIKMKQQVAQVGRRDIFSVDRFIEKPNETTAKRLVSEWQYLWNIGVFMFRVDAMLDKYRRWLPASYRLLMRMAEDIGTRREAATIKRLFPKMEKISIDYGIMEHDRDMLVVPADVTWMDIGSWREVYDMLATTTDMNVTRGQHVSLDSRGNLIYSLSGKVVATAGLHNMIVVETEDALLICPKDRSQDVKHLVSELEARKLHRYL